jgi:hypothetical protein
VLFKSKTNGVVAILVFSLIASSTGCTKEKAQAIKTAAEQFNVEAKAAINLIRDGNKLNVTVMFTSSAQEVKSIADNFRTSTETTVTFVNNKLSRNQNSGSGNPELEKALAQMEQAYELFGSMFRSLPRGNFFAKNAVKKSKVFAIKLTVEMIEVAKVLKDHHFEFGARRQDLYDQFDAAKKLTDPTAQKEAVLLATQQLIKLRDDEAKANTDTITQCLKAAEAGKLITDLIDKYQSLTVGDILDLTKDSLGIINDVTGGNHDVTAAIARYEAFRTNKINTDPLWKDVLNTDVKGLESLSGSSKP